MSGAEAAIAGVGFLCNAMQIVTFGRDVLQVCRQIRASSSPDPNLQGYLKSAEACFSQRKAYFDQMKASASAASQAQGLNSDLQHIIEVGKKLDDSMDELQSKFAKLHLNSASKGGIRGSARTVKKAVASMWQSNQLKSLEENVKRYESLLHGVMVHNICNQLQAAKIQTSKSFHQLNQDLQSFITKLADGCTKLSELSLASLETRDRVTQEHETTRTAINQGFTSTQGAVSSMHNSMSQRLQESAQRDLSSDLKKRHERLLDSLRFSEMNSRKNQVSENYPGTFLWVFKKKSDGSQTQRVSRAETYNKDGDIHMNDASTSAPGTGSQSPVSFPSWLECDANLFWISGKPASGKSSLMKFLATNSLTIEHLRIWQRSIQMSDGKLRIITHYFWKAGESLQNNIQGMMLSLLHQVLNKDLCLAQRLWEDQENVSDKRAYGDWSLKELRHALCRTIRSSGDAFCIFLDGTDEAKELEHLSWRDRGNSQIIHDLLCLSNVKICASSREEHPFCLFFEGMPRLRIHLLTYGDIYRFAENKLESSSVDCNYRGHILRTIVEKANGVFLWVVLVLDSVNRAIRSGTASTDEIQERLEQTPADLTDLLIDMWERPGDDAKLSSYKTDASRYFSLVVTAKRMEEDIGWEHVSSFPYHMNSILVIATALEDEPVTSIIHKGRSIQAEELQDRCSRVANRLRLISRGLLETTTSANWDCKGDPRLMDYNRQRINFIHRSAFDFITDTQFGRERLSTCQWSPVEQVSRLLGGHLVRSRFLYVEPRLETVRSRRKKSYIVGQNWSSELAVALTMIHYRQDPNLPPESSMLRIVRGWQESGLFCGQSHWIYPQGSKVPSNPRDLEFLKGIICVAPRFDTVVGLLDQISIHDLIDATPVLLRALSFLDDGEMSEPILLELVGYILTRLSDVSSENQQGVSSGDQASVRNATFLLHSMFIIQSLHAISIGSTDLVCQDFSNLLDRFEKTLSSTDDWQYQFVLTCEENRRSSFSVAGLYDELSEDLVIVAIVNFVTAYRILGRLFQDRLCCALNAQVPEGSGERFEIVLIGGEESFTGYARRIFSPETEYHDLISAQLIDTLFRIHTVEHLKERTEAWQEPNTFNILQWLLSWLNSKTVLFETATAVYNITIKYLLEGVGPADPPKNGLTSSNGQDTAQTYEQTYGGRIIGSVLPPINVPLTGGATHGIVRVPASQEGAIVPLSTVKISFDSEFIKLVDAYYAGDSIFWTISWEKLPTEEGKNPQSVDVITSIPHTQFGGLTSWTRIVQPYTVVFYVLEK